jgi:hypothetical protein
MPRALDQTAGKASQVYKVKYILDLDPGAVTYLITGEV